MKKIRSILAFALALSMCASMAACGSSEDSSSESKSEKEVATTTEATSDNDDDESEDTTQSETTGPEQSDDAEDTPESTITVDDCEAAAIEATTYANVDEAAAALADRFGIDLDSKDVSEYHNDDGSWDYYGATYQIKTPFYLFGNDENSLPPVNEMVISSTFSDQAPLTISFYMKEPAGTRDLDGSDEKYGEVWLKLKNDVSSILDEKYGESESDTLGGSHGWTWNPADKAFSVHFEIVKTAKLTDTEDKYFIWYDFKTYGDEADQ